MTNALVNTEKKYGEMLDLLMESGIPFMVSGTFALAFYTGYLRETKDIDVFCKPSDSTRLLKFLKDAGYKVEIKDPRWLAKAYSGQNYIDIIFGFPSGTTVVDDSWYENAVEGEMFGRKMKIVSPEDLILSKAYVQERVYFQGADVNHIILKQGEKLNWEKVLKRFDHHWPLLFSVLMNFRFVYPSSRNIIPKWLLKELVARLNEETMIPEPKDKVCLGPLLSRTQYEVDLTDWGYKVVT